MKYHQNTANLNILELLENLIPTNLDKQFVLSFMTGTYMFDNGEGAYNYYAKYVETSSQIMHFGYVIVNNCVFIEL